MNILHRSHADISALCSGKEKGEARFSLGRWEDDAGGIPYLADAQASFLCRQERSLDYGTHSHRHWTGREGFDPRQCGPARLCGRHL